MYSAVKVYVDYMYIVYVPSVITFAKKKESVVLDYMYVPTRFRAALSPAIPVETFLIFTSYSRYRTTHPHSMCNAYTYYNMNKWTMGIFIHLAVSFVFGENDILQQGVAFRALRDG